MQIPGNIHYISNKEIDRSKWDNCITSAKNGLIYGYSWYLDHMAANWDALVLEDYAAVMPVTWNKKFGIYYIYQPFITAQLGVFGNNIEQALLERFFDSIPSRFKYWDIYLNHGNVFPQERYNTYHRSNYVLDLNKPYEQISQGYRDNVKRNRKKALELGCYPLNNVHVEDLIRLALKQMRHQSKVVYDNVNRFRSLYKFMSEKQAVIYGIYSAANELLSSAAFFYAGDRAYYILVGNHPNGRTIGASHALIDAFIHAHAGKNLKLDFEGSDLRNLAFFYSSFGAVEEPYMGLNRNKLPWYIKWLKK